MVDPEFPIHVLENILAEIPWSDMKGFMTKQYSCGKCNSPIQISDINKKEQFNFKIPWRENSIASTVTGPGMKCGACMTAQMPKTNQLRRADIPNALVNAFGSVGLKR